MHKLVPRVLSATLKGVIGKLVRDSQSSFIKGRSIFDGCTVASEVLDTMRRDGEGVVFKIDFEKTFDCVDWDRWFILYKMGFRKKWIC